jgi:hypothetical protein
MAGIGRECDLRQESGPLRAPDRISIDGAAPACLPGSLAAGTAVCARISFEKQSEESDFRIQAGQCLQVAALALAQAVLQLVMALDAVEIGGLIHAEGIGADRLQGVGAQKALGGKLGQLDQAAQIIRKTGIFDKYTQGRHDLDSLLNVSVIEE